MEATTGFSTLNFSGFDFDDKDIQRLAGFFSEVKNVVALDLSCNNIGDDSAPLLCKIFKNNKSLQNIDLSSNQMSSSGIAYLCQNSPMVSIQFRDNLMNCLRVVSGRYPGLNQPMGLCVWNNENILVADYNNNRVVVLDLAHELEEIFQFSVQEPCDIAHCNDRFYVSTDKSGIQVFSREGSLLFSFGKNFLENPLGLEIYEERLLLIAHQKGVVIANADTGEFIRSFTNLCSEPCRFLKIAQNKVFISTETDILILDNFLSLSGESQVRIWENKGMCIQGIYIVGNRLYASDMNRTICLDPNGVQVQEWRTSPGAFGITVIPNAAGLIMYQTDNLDSKIRVFMLDTEQEI